MNAKYPPGYFTKPALEWWPTFRSVCCDPSSPYFVFRNASQVKAAELLKAAKASQANGVGWGAGTIPGVKRGES